jgi:hypothetical protein
MTDLRSAHQFLSIWIHRRLSSDIGLSQEKFVNMVLQQFQIENCNGIATSMESGIQVWHSQESNEQDPDVQQQHQDPEARQQHQDPKVIQ